VILLNLNFFKNICFFNLEFFFFLLANIDIVSGTKAPDLRFSLKTFYDLPSEGSEIEEAVNNVQSQIFSERDGMWFKSKDFAGTVIKRAVIRQVIRKKCYK
jgi:hypothetical protein